MTTQTAEAMNWIEDADTFNGHWTSDENHEMKLYIRQRLIDRDTQLTEQAALIERLEAALCFYADTKVYSFVGFRNCQIADDMGSIAREALAAVAKWRDGK